MNLDPLIKLLPSIFRYCFITYSVCIYVSFASAHISSVLHSQQRSQLQPRSSQEPLKEWTFMIFMNGHNSLDFFGGLNIKSMEYVGSSEQINVVVQWASKRYPKTRRLLVEKSSDTSRITSPIVEELPRVDMGDYHSLIDFVRWTHEHYPAKRYFINVWNHGNGWKMQQFSAQDISNDDYTGNKITTEQLGLAMSAASDIIGKKVDIYGSDACLMASLEVAGEMSNSVEYFVGSEELEPSDGWPYRYFLQVWMDRPAMSTKEVVQLLSSEYLKAYSDGVFGVGEVTLSAFDLKQMPSLLEAIRELSTELQQLNQEKMTSVQTIAANTQAFFYSDYIDFGDFLLRLSKDKTLSLNSLQVVQAQLGQFVVANKVSRSYRAAHGAAIWFPTRQDWEPLKDRYSNLEFARATDWMNVLSKIYP